MKIITLADGTKLSAIQVNMVLDGLKDMSYLDEPKEWPQECPQVGDKYWCVGEEGDVYDYGWSGDNFDIGCQKQNNIYQTAKEAEMAVIRDRGMKVKNTGEKGEKFWVWDFGDNAPWSHLGSRQEIAWNLHAMYPKFKTEEEAQAWGDEYSSAFIYFNK